MKELNTAYEMLSFNNIGKKKEIHSPMLNYFFKSVTVPADVYHAMRESQIKCGFIPMS